MLIAVSLGRVGMVDFKAFETAVRIVEPDFVESPPVVYSMLAIERELPCLSVVFFSTAYVLSGLSTGLGGYSYPA